MTAIGNISSSRIKTTTYLRLLSRRRVSSTLTRNTKTVRIIRTRTTIEVLYRFFWQNRFMNDGAP